jgi:DNA excision repair protein ERCC-1
LSGVKGLGATKVTSLVDAFNKPFMVGGLKRSDGTVRPASDLTASKEMTTSDRVEEAQARAEADGEGGQVTGPSKSRGQEQDDVEEMGSPDWPSDVDENEEEMQVGRGTEKVPSRSPPPIAGDLDDVWHDPLEEEEGEDTGPPAKRRRDS